MEMDLATNFDPESLPDDTEFRRFNWFHISMHYVLIASFMGLAITGMPLKYRNALWAPILMDLFGGVHSAGLIHRICAAVLLTDFTAAFIWAIVYWVLIKRMPFFGPDSIFFNLKDVWDVRDNIRYFLGLGKQPKFERYSYWEKFDFFAVFWGMFAIGFTGLCLWFPEIASRFFPGKFLNIAIIMHSDEALLAAAFIFVVHWFNAHFRPEKFPIDMVIFTGKLTKEELKHERPLEWERIKNDPELFRRRLVKRTRS